MKNFINFFILISLCCDLEVMAQSGSKRLFANSTTKIYEAEATSAVSGAIKMAAASASGGYVMSLAKAGDGVSFKNAKGAQKVAIRYSSMGVGVLDVTINGKSYQKVNIHSSGNLTGSFLNAIIGIKIPADANVAV